MNHTFVILTRHNETSSHSETEVTIDWTGVTQEQLMTLAKWALVQDLQARIRKEDRKAPERITIVAAQQVREEPAALIQYDPKKLKSVKCLESKRDNLLNNLLKQLSPEELAVLLQ